MPSSLADQIIELVANATVTRVDKPWGHEVILDTGEFLLKFIQVHKEHQTSLQFHERKREVIVKIAWSGAIEIEGERHTQQEPHVIEPNVVHRSIGPLQLIEVTTMDNEDVVRLDDDYGR